MEERDEGAYVGRERARELENFGNKKKSGLLGSISLQSEVKGKKWKRLAREEHGPKREANKGDIFSGSKHPSSDDEREKAGKNEYCLLTPR